MALDIFGLGVELSHGYKRAASPEDTRQVYIGSKSFRRCLTLESSRYIQPGSWTAIWKVF